MKKLKKKIIQTNKSVYKMLKQLFKTQTKFSNEMKKIWLSLFAFMLICTAICISSCNVTRVVTTSSEYYQRGDTSCVIQTKTIETYDAYKKM